MTKNFNEILQDLNQRMEMFSQESPATLEAFMGLHQVALADGALSAKQKELMALGIAIAVRCEGCIAFHTAAALEAGATKPELIETVNVAIMMGGGPAVVYGTQVLIALEQLPE